jgi:hypothetical protein
MIATRKYIVFGLKKSEISEHPVRKPEIITITYSIQLNVRFVRSDRHTTDRFQASEFLR